MASAWQTMEEAALTMGVSSRTLHRRITKGEVETRLIHGRREVLVEIPEPPEQSTAQPEHAAETPAAAPAANVGQADAPAAVVAGENSGVLALHEDRIRRTDMAIAAYQQSVTVAAAEARRRRASAQVAWSAAAAAVVALFLVAIWSTHRLTAASAQVQNLNERVGRLSDESAANAASAERFRRQAESAQVEAARAEGELASRRQFAGATIRPAAAPATRPAVSDMSAAPLEKLMDRLTALMKGK